MIFYQHVSLKPYNSFGVDIPAVRLSEITTQADIRQVVSDKSLPAEKHIIGGGSNILLTKPVNGLVLLNRIKGIHLLKEDSNHVWLSVAGGENWHQFVMYTIEQGWAGIENLALIPGTVGAAPIQNIGAYGVEVKEVVDTVNCVSLADGRSITLSNEACRFGYRDSIFKQELKDAVFIYSVVFRLNKQANFKTSYGAIGDELTKMGATNLTIKNIAQAVINIRQSKLPDPATLGNAGSFFKNPTVEKGIFLLLQQQYPSIPYYNVDERLVKIPAGWLIETSGLKGYRAEHVGVHEKQALVLVNYGEGSGLEVLALSQKIIDTVHEKFGIWLEREVNIW